MKDFEEIKEDRDNDNKKNSDESYQTLHQIFITQKNVAKETN